MQMENIGTFLKWQLISDCITRRYLSPVFTKDYSNNDAHVTYLSPDKTGAHEEKEKRRKKCRMTNAGCFAPAFSFLFVASKSLSCYICIGSMRIKLLRLTYMYIS